MVRTNPTINLVGKNGNSGVLVTKQLKLPRVSIWKKK